MPIQVIGAGLGRTGTLSLKAALEELGFAKCYHMVEVLAHKNNARIWADAASGEPIDWDALFAGYQATVNWPGCSFYKELSERYPGAKVILTVRDPERWYDSAPDDLLRPQRLAGLGRCVHAQDAREFGRMVNRIIWTGTFQGRFEDRAFAIGVFKRHNDEVRREVPADRLLVYDVREGWGPLCTFLGVPAPDGKPFPHLNDAVEFRARIERMGRAMRTVGYVGIGVVALVLIVVAIRLGS